LGCLRTARDHLETSRRSFTAENSNKEKNKGSFYFAREGGGEAGEASGRMPKTSSRALHSACLGKKKGQRTKTHFTRPVSKKRSKGGRGIGKMAVRDCAERTNQGLPDSFPEKTKGSERKNPKGGGGGGGKGGREGEVNLNL